MRDLIKRILREAVGVPKDIDIAAENLYNDIVEKLRTLDEDDLGNPIYFPNNGGKYSYADFKPKRVELTIKLGEFAIDNKDNIKDPLIAGMGVSSYSKVTPEFNIVSHDVDEIDLDITYAVPEGYNNIHPSEIADVLEKKKSDSISSLAHELMHSYEKEKKPSEPIKRRARYSVQNSFRTPIRSINEFLFGMYYTNAIENYVRPTEVYSYLKQIGTTEKDFLEKLSSSDIVKKLLRYRDYSYEDLKNSLYNDMDSVNEVIENTEGYPGPTNTDEEKVNAALEIIHNKFMSEVLEHVKEIGNKALAQTNPFEMFMSMLTGNVDDKGLIKVMKDSTKFRNDYDKWYRYEIKKMNRVSNELYRKLSKLYSLMKKEESPTIKTEIFDPTSFEIEEFIRKNKK